MILDRLTKAVPAFARARDSLVARLVGSFLTVSILTVVFVAVVSFFEARRALRSAVADRLSAVAVAKEDEINRWVETERDLIVFIAESAELTKDLKRMSTPESAAARERIETVLRSAIGPHGRLEELYLMSPEGGEVVASTHALRLGVYHVSDLFYTRGKRETFIQNVYTSPLTGRPAMTIASPVTDDTGETIAVLAGDLDLAYADRLMEDRTGLSATGAAYLVSTFNDFVSSERFGREQFGRGVFSEAINEALSGASGVGVYTNYAGTPVIGAYRWNPARDLALIVELDQAEAFAPARRLVLTILGIGLVSALMLAGGVVVLARQIARPILSLTRAATAVADGDFTTTAPVMTSDEVGVLARAFNEMTARLRQLYADLRDNVDTVGKTVVALEKSQQLLQSIIDNSTTLIAVTDPDGRFLLLNKSFERLAGVSQERATGRSPRDLLPPKAAEQYLDAVETAWLERRVVERELSFQLDHEERSFILVAFPLGASDEDVYGVGVVATDLTDIKRAQHEHEHLEAQVQHAQKLESLGLMAGGIAHDFNNILTSLLGNTELALTHLEPDSRPAVYLGRVVTATKQAANLTNQMLAYAGKASFHQEILDLNTLVYELTQLVEASIPKKITFETELAVKPVMIKANHAQLTQLVINLVANAAEAIGENDGQVTVRTRRVEGEPATVQLAVSDTGRGMDRTTRERIFDPFFSTKGAGRGLGLAAVRGIVKSAAGELLVNTTPGQGSTFEVNFPAALAEQVEATSARAAETPEPGSGKILVVDDEHAVRTIARDLLESSGFTVLEAKNGVEAIDVYRARRSEIDVVLLDMTMPGMSGADALREIRKLESDARVILTSGYDGQDTVAQREELTGVAFLQKPYRARTLLSKIAHVLEDMDRTAVPGELPH